MPEPHTPSPAGFRPVTVFLSDAAQPLALTWETQRLAISDWGRRWRSPSGHHQLVRVRDARVFELLNTGGDWLARLVSAPPHLI